MKEIKVADRIISTNSEPFIIAEMSGNHGGSLDKALKLVDAAATTGADAIKIQTFTADSMTLNLNQDEFVISDPKSLWAGRSLYELYEQASTPYDWHQPIFERAKKLGLIAFSSPFDLDAVDFLESLNAPLYKIASFENSHHPLLARVAQTGKPVILSTGTATIEEIFESLAVLRNNGCDQIVILKCTSSYPADPADINLATLAHLQNVMDCYVGLSDHTLGIGVPIAAIALGARVIEKHFKLEGDTQSVDAAFSLDPQEFAQMVTQSRDAFKSVGHQTYKTEASNYSQRKYRRSVYVSNDIAKGEEFTRENIQIIRPGLGLEPKYYNIILGKFALRDLKKGTPVDWNVIN